MTFWVLGGGGCQYLIFPLLLFQALLTLAVSCKVDGVVEDKGSGVKAATLTGRWDDSMYCTINNDVSISNSCASAQQNTTLLWKKNKPPENPTRYNLTSFAITLNEITPDFKVDISFHIPLCFFLLLLLSLGSSCVVHYDENIQLNRAYF